MNIEEAYLLSESRALLIPMDTNEQAAQMAGGMEPAGAEPMTLGEFGTSAADTVAGIVKGAVQGTVGLPGDIESLVYGVREMIRREAGQGAIDAFLQGLESGTILPTTEDVKQFLDKTIGPLVPEGASEKRREAAKTPEFVGELGGAGKAVKETVKAVAKATKGLPVGASIMPEGEFKSAVEAVANPKAFNARIAKTMGEKDAEIISKKMREYLDKDLIPSAAIKNIEKDIGQKLTKEQTELVRDFISAQRALKRKGASPKAQEERK
jgi:hypothetical protein